MIIRPLTLAALPPAQILPETIGPYLALMLIGFGIGMLGHLIQRRTLVAIGIALVFLATVVFPLAINLSRETPPEVRDHPTNRK